MVSLVSEKMNILKDLCRKHQVKSRSLIGSAAREVDFSEGSDLDFVYEFEQRISFEDYASKYFSFQEQLKKLFRRPIDLVPVHGSKNSVLFAKYCRG